MRITERELRQKISAMISESPDTDDNPWEMYAPTWQADVPQGLYRALVKICSDTEAHIEANYPPRPSEPRKQDTWNREIKESTQGDPVVERAVDTIIMIVRTMLPPEVRSDLNIGAARGSIRYWCLNTFAHAFVPFKTRQEAKIEFLLSTIASALKASSEG